MTAKSKTTEQCKGCSVSVWHPFAEIEAQMEEYLRIIDLDDRVAETEYQERLAQCTNCEGLYYGSTCRYCGCFVRIRALRINKACPSPEGNKWLKP